MTWQPGHPIRSEQDRREWQAWRRERKLQQQRDRRARYPRIDYYPCPEAKKIIDDLSWPYTRADMSSAINNIVLQWTERRTLPPE